MSTFSTLMSFSREDCWRPTFRQYCRKVLKRNGDRKGLVLKAKNHNEKNDSEFFDQHIILPKTSLLDESTFVISNTPTLNGVETYRSLQISPGKKYTINEEVPVPEFVNDEEIMIRTCAVGLNNIDWKSVDYNFCLPELPWVTGREMAGIVHRVAPGVTRFQPGDKVWTSTYYKDIRAGCFQDLVTVPQHTVLPLPSNTSFEDAACLGVAGLTAAMSLWRWLDVPFTAAPLCNREEKEMLLIWGGSTVTGQFATQIAKYANVEVIAVTSCKTSLLVKSLGAQHIVTRDGKTNEVISKEIRAIGGDRITRGIDLVGDKTAPFCIQALSSVRQALFAPLAMMKEQQVPKNVKVVNVEMKQFVLNEECQIYAEKLNQMVSDGDLKLPELDISRGGLSVIEQGLNRIKRGDMSGKKLVVSWDSKT